MALKPETRAQLDELVERRISHNAGQIRHSLQQIAIGNPLGAEPEPERALDRLRMKLRKSPTTVEEVAASIRARATASDLSERLGQDAGDGREAVWGQTLDFLDVSFLERGALAADAVARVAFRDGRAQGSGLLVAPGLLLTNNHVIETPSAAAELCVEFRFERAATLRGSAAAFAFNPTTCFVFDDIEGLDFTLICIGEQLKGSDPIERFRHLPLSDAPDKHMLGEVANIIQHPRGRYKELVLRENQLVGRDELARVLHYVADTEPGSSGSPVFNNDWEVIALHHWGGPWLENRDAMGRRREINEGIRISAIVKHLRGLTAHLQGANRAAVQEALRLWDAAPRMSERFLSRTLAREYNVSTAERRRAPVEDFSDRGGYEPGFLQGFVVPLPRLADDHTPARNRKALIGEDPYELRYHHFSIVMNAERRLPYFTACNIDGSRVVAVDREDKTVIEEPSLKDLGVERNGAEASDAFRPDPRVSLDEQMTRPFYEKQVVQGYPDPQDQGRIARMLQKGHIIMRGDPAWGVEEEALAAERDTFFYTNAAPQVGFFNQGSALNRPGSKGKLRWRAVETYVLRNAYTMRQRVTVFAGPIFKNTDPEYRFGSQVPLQFWKIACWVEEGELRSIALVASQRNVLKVMPEALEAPEAFLDEDEIARVSEFLSTVDYIEQETRLDFGDSVRNADVRGGKSALEAADTGAGALALGPTTRKSTTANTAKVAANKDEAKTAKPRRGRQK